MATLEFNWPVIRNTTAPIEFLKDGTPTNVELDTVTPANSNGLPVLALDTSGTPIDPATETTLLLVQGDTSAIAASSANIETSTANIDTSTANIDTTTQSIDGKLPASLGQTTMGNSLAVTLASDQSDLPVMLQGYVDASNSSTTALPGGGVFTGTAIDITDYATVQVSVATDVASATNGLSVQYSSDGINWDHKHEYTIPAMGFSYSFPAELQFVRIVYTNGAVAQSYMRLETILKTTFVPPSEYTVSQPVNQYQLASITKSVIYGQTTAGGGSYVGVKVNPSGALTVDATISGLDASVLGQETMTNSLPVVIASDQSAIGITAASLPLPTGAATDDAEGSPTGGTAGTKSLLAGGIYNSVAPTLTNGQQASLQLDSAGNLKTTATFTGTIGAVDQGNQGTIAESWYVALTDGSTNAVKVTDSAVVTADFALAVGLHPDSPLPVGNNNIGDVDVATLPVTYAAGNSDASTQRVVIATDQAAVATKAPAGRTKVDNIFLDYSLSNVTTAAYTQIIASTSATTNLVEIFDSSGELMILATGAGGAEVDQLYIMPGGNGPVQFTIASGTRLSVKAKTATANGGFLAINLYS